MKKVFNKIINLIISIEFYWLPTSQEETLICLILDHYFLYKLKENLKKI